MPYSFPLDFKHITNIQVPTSLWISWLELPLSFLHKSHWQSHNPSLSISCFTKWAENLKTHVKFSHIELPWFVRIFPDYFTVIFHTSSHISVISFVESFQSIQLSFLGTHCLCTNISSVCVVIDYMVIWYQWKYTWYKQQENTGSLLLANRQLNTESCVFTPRVSKL